MLYSPPSCGVPSVCPDPLAFTRASPDNPGVPSLPSSQGIRGFQSSYLCPLQASACLNLSTARGGQAWTPRLPDVPPSFLSGPSFLFGLTLSTFIQDLPFIFKLMNNFIFPLILISLAEILITVIACCAINYKNCYPPFDLRVNWR